MSCILVSPSEPRFLSVLEVCMHLMEILRQFGIKRVASVVIAKSDVRQHYPLDAIAQNSETAGIARPTIEQDTCPGVAALVVLP